MSDAPTPAGELTPDVTQEVTQVVTEQVAAPFPLHITEVVTEEMAAPPAVVTQEVPLTITQEVSLQFREEQNRAAMRMHSSIANLGECIRGLSTLSPEERDALIEAYDSLIGFIKPYRFRSVAPIAPIKQLTPITLVAISPSRIVAGAPEPEYLDGVTPEYSPKDAAAFYKLSLQERPNDPITIVRRMTIKENPSKPGIVTQIDGIVPIPRGIETRKMQLMATYITFDEQGGEHTLCAIPMGLPLDQFQYPDVMNVPGNPMERARVFLRFTLGMVSR